MTGDRGIEPVGALPVEDADDADAVDPRFDVLAQPLAEPVAAPVAERGAAPVAAPVAEPVAAPVAAAVAETFPEPLAVRDPEPRAVAAPAERAGAPGPLDAEPLAPTTPAAEPRPDSEDDGLPRPATDADVEAPGPSPDLAGTADAGEVAPTMPMWLPATATEVAGTHVGPAVLEAQPAPSAPRHRRQPWALLVLAILLALTLGLATYLLQTTRAYERRSAEWEAAARTTGADLTQARAELEATTSDLAATRDQLATAQARIIELADEKAQLGDDRAIQRQLVDYQQRISKAAGNVATALNSCIDGQYKLIGYLENPSAYDQADLARFRTDVQTVCGAATDANAALQRELKK